MATLTGSLCAASISPRYVHEGVFPVVLEYNNGIGAAAARTVSAGDTVLMGKVAHGVTILDGYFVQTSAANETAQISVGIDSSLVNLLAATSTSNGEIIRLAASAAFPYTVSVSDDATIRYHLVKVDMGSTEVSTTTSFKVVLFCTTDP